MAFGWAVQTGIIVALGLLKWTYRRTKLHTLSRMAAPSNCSAGVGVHGALKSRTGEQGPLFVIVGLYLAQFPGIFQAVPLDLLFVLEPFRISSTQLCESIAGLSLESLQHLVFGPGCVFDLAAVLFAGDLELEN